MTGWAILAVVQALFALGNLLLWRMQGRQIDAAFALARDVVENLKIASASASSVQETTRSLLAANEAAVARLKAMFGVKP